MKVLVGCPTSDHKAYCIEEYAKAVKNLTYEGYDILLVDNSKNDKYTEKLKGLDLPTQRIEYCEGARERIVKSRNLIREIVLKDGYDYFLSLEQDVIPPKYVIERLLAHGKDVVSGVYFKNFTFRDNEGRVIKREILPLAYKMVNNDMAKQLTFDEVKGDGLIKVSATGVGCMLIKREVLEKIKFRYVQDKKPFDDVWFCKDVREKGYDVYLDKSVKCKHLVEGMDWDKIKK